MLRGFGYVCPAPNILFCFTHVSIQYAYQCRCRIASFRLTDRRAWSIVLSRILPGMVEWILVLPFYKVEQTRFGLVQHSLHSWNSIQTTCTPQYVSIESLTVCRRRNLHRVPVRPLNPHDGPEAPARTSLRRHACTAWICTEASLQSNGLYLLYIWSLNSGLLFYTMDSLPVLIS